jgi:hypothetical protein
MHGPDEVDYSNTNVFVEVVKSERIVIKHVVLPYFWRKQSMRFWMGKTKLTYSTVFEENAAVFDKLKTYAVPGAKQTMDRLEKHMANMS